MLTRLRSITCARWITIHYQLYTKECTILLQGECDHLKWFISSSIRSSELAVLKHEESGPFLLGSPQPSLDPPHPTPTLLTTRSLLHWTKTVGQCEQCWLKMFKVAFSPARTLEDHKDMSTGVSLPLTSCYSEREPVLFFFLSEESLDSRERRKPRLVSLIQPWGQLTFYPVDPESNFSHICLL